MTAGSLLPVRLIVVAVIEMQTGEEKHLLTPIELLEKLLIGSFHSILYRSQNHLC